MAEPIKTEEPAPTAETPAAPQPRRRAARTGASLSLNSIMQEKEDDAVADSSDAGVEVPALDDESAAKYWKVLCGQFPDKPRLANALANAKLSLSEEEGYQVLVFAVTNEAQKSWIASNLLHDIETRFRKISSNPKVRLVVDAVQFVAEKVIYTPEDKVRALMEERPEVIDLIKDFELDIR